LAPEKLSQTNIRIGKRNAHLKKSVMKLQVAVRPDIS
jgi:hypothetical protein